MAKAGLPRLMLLPTPERFSLHLWHDACGLTRVMCGRFVIASEQTIVAHSRQRAIIRPKGSLNPEL